MMLSQTSVSISSKLQKAGAGWSPNSMDIERNSLVLYSILAVSNFVSSESVNEYIVSQLIQERREIRKMKRKDFCDVKSS